MKRFFPFAIIVIVLAGALAAGWYWWKAAHKSPASEPSNSGIPAVPTSAPAGAQPQHVRGSETAPVTLEEFGDFECPSCGLFYPVLKTIEGAYGSRLRVIFREFPLTTPHPHALAAAHAAEAAGLQGRFWEMHDLLYENQEAWAKAFDVRPIFEGYASKLGLDVERFKQDQTSEAVDNRIFLDGLRAHSFGVQGTPTIYINGRGIPYEEFRTVEALRASIDKALAK
jgi:protein-disulfide isomerase